MTTEITLAVTNGQATTTSLQVAEKFNKRHDDVLKAVRNLECPPEFHARNFAAMSVDVIVGNGAVRQSPAYTITRDGFTLLAMGFTGKEAAQWKVKYIAAFNKMEAMLRGGNITQARFDEAYPKASRLFHATVAALRNDHGLRAAYQMANTETIKASGIDLIDIWELDINTLPETPKRLKTAAEQTDKLMSRLLSIIGNATRYNDKKFDKALKAGVMPDGKLLALMKQPVEKVRPLLTKAQGEALIVAQDGKAFGQACAVYVLVPEGV